MSNVRERYAFRWSFRLSSICRLLAYLAIGVALWRYGLAPISWLGTHAWLHCFGLAAHDSDCLFVAVGCVSPLAEKNLNPLRCENGAYCTRCIFHSHSTPFSTVPSQLSNTSLKVAPFGRWTPQKRGAL